MTTPTTMLYRAPGPHQIHGGDFDYVIVEDDRVEEKLAEGWYLTTTEAREAHEEEQADAAARAEEAQRQRAENGRPTRDELEQKATELGIPFSARVSDKKLAEAILAKLAGGAS